MPIDKTKLQSVDQVYPLKVAPYEEYMTVTENPSVVAKLNAMLQSLHQMGRLTNQTVAQWNRVMDWIVNGGMDEIATNITTEKVEVALTEVMRMLDVSLNSGLKDLATDVTDKKISELLTTGQFESMVSESLVEINNVVENKLVGFNLQLTDKVGGGVKAEPEDLSANTLALLTGQGTIDLETIPQDNSVTNVKIANNAVTNEKISYVSASKVSSNLLEQPFFSKFTAESNPSYSHLFQTDENGDLTNNATSTFPYTFDSLPLPFPENFELSFVITVDKTTSNGQFHGFSKRGTTTRFLFGYEPAHKGFEIFTPSGFVMLENDSNFLSGEYAFTFVKVGGSVSLRIKGDSYERVFEIKKYTTFNLADYDSIKLQFKIPSVGGKLKDLTLFKKESVEKTFSLRGTMEGRQVHTYKFGGKGNDWCFVRTPPNYDPNRQQPYPFVITNHGNGWNMNGSEQLANWTKRTMYVKADDPDYIANPSQYNLVPSNKPELLYSNPTIEALLSAGYIVCGAQNYADNLYGNNDCRNAMQDFYFHMIKNYNAEEKCFMIGASNGAMTSLNGMYLLNGVERVKAMILQYPLTSLWAHYNNYSAHQSAIESAYGIATGLSEEQFEKETRTHDPAKVNTVLIGTERIKTTALPPIKLYYSFGDVVTHPDNNAIPFMEVLENSNAIHEGVIATGGHGDFSHFAPADYVAWFEKYR